MKLWEVSLPMEPKNEKLVNYWYSDNFIIVTCEKLNFMIQTTNFNISIQIC